MVEPLSLNFTVISVMFVGFQQLRNFVLTTPTVLRWRVLPLDNIMSMQRKIYWENKISINCPLSLSAQFFF